MKFRHGLIEEEYKELTDQLYNDCQAGKISPNLLKEAFDLLYVVYGLIAALGYDGDVVFERGHASNMSKLGEDGKPIYRDDGKVLKGPNYKPADMSDLV